MKTLLMILVVSIMCFAQIDEQIEKLYSTDASKRVSAVVYLLKASENDSPDGDYQPVVIMIIDTSAFNKIEYMQVNDNTFRIEHNVIDQLIEKIPDNGLVCGEFLISISSLLYQMNLSNLSINQWQKIVLLKNNHAYRKSEMYQSIGMLRNVRKYIDGALAKQTDWKVH